MGRLRGWMRLALLLSAFWLIGVSAYAAFQFHSTNSDLSGQTKSGPFKDVPQSQDASVADDLVWSPVSPFASCKLVTRNISCSFNWTRFATIAILPLLAFWIVIVSGFGVRWVINGFK